MDTQTGRQVRDMRELEKQRDEATQRRLELEHELAQLGDITTAERPAQWVMARDDLRLAALSAKAEELRCEIGLLEEANEELRSQRPEARANVEMIEAERESVERRLREARRAAGALEYQANLNTDKRRRLENELEGILLHLRDQAAPVVRARNVA